MKRQVWFTLLLLLAFDLPAADIPWGYEKVSNEYGVPAAILYSVALQESEGPGLGLPWPWTANVKGKGYYFDTREDLYRFLQSLLSRGHKSFDIGPGQINWYWNGERFASLWEATDPYTNLRTSASILREHYSDTGSWAEAVGRYHSPGNAHRALKYTVGVGRKLARVLEEAP